jgi:hypothetical protein
LLLTSAMGCMSVPSDEPPDRRGLVTPMDGVPRQAVEEYKRRTGGENVRSVERIEKGSLYRFEIGSGSIIFIDGQGEWRGIII